MRLSSYIIRFLWGTLIAFDLFFSSFFSKAFLMPSFFSYLTYYIFIAIVILQPRTLFLSFFPYIIFIFTFISAMKGDFMGLKAGMFFNFITFATVVYAYKTDIFEHFKAFFVMYFYGYSLLVGASIAMVILGMRTQPYTGMYTYQSSGGIPVLIYGLFSDKNIYGLMNGILFLIVFLVKDMKFRKPLMWFLILFEILSGSRSGMVGCVACLLYYNLFNPELPFTKRFFKTVLYLGFFLLAYKLWEGSMLNMRGGSLAGRDVFWEEALPFVRSHFWWGIGRAFTPGGIYLTLHNFYAQLLVEEGFFCLATYLLFFFHILRKSKLSSQVLMFFFMIFAGLNPILVPGQLAAFASCMILGNYIEFLNKESKEGRQPLWFIKKHEPEIQPEPLEIMVPA